MDSGLIVEDHLAAQQWLGEALQGAFAGITISLAATLEEAHGVIDVMKPQIALIDLNLPDGNGLELIERLRSESPDTLTVVATIYDDDDHLFPALRAGAQGYILKEQRQEEIRRLLKGISSGEPPLSPAISQRMLSYFSANDVRQATPMNNPLSEREQQVLMHIAQGMSLNMVAEQLGVTRNTVATQVKSIYRKLSISSRAEAATVAAQLGLIG
jgi:DNA-binding NarL/FixJ family response regulator